MAQKAGFIGSTDIMGAYDTFIEKAPYWSIVNGKRIASQYNEDDPAEARDMFETMIEAFENSRNTDIFTVQFHPILTDGWIVEGKTPVKYSIVCKAYQPGNDEFVVNGVDGGMPGRAYKGLQIGLTNELKQAIIPLAETITGISDRIKALEESDGKQQPASIWESLANRFMEKPEELIGLIGSVAPAIMPLVTGMIGKVVPGLNPSQMQSNLRVAGVPGGADALSAVNNVYDAAKGEVHENGSLKPYDEGLTEDQINHIAEGLDELNPYIDLQTDLHLLAAYAKKNPEMFNGLLTMLRNG